MIRRFAGETFRSLEVPNFRRFFAGQFVSQVGNWMTLIAQALFVLELTDSGIAVGILVAFQFAPVLLIGPWAGLVADRSDKRKLLFGVQVFAMAQSFALAALAFTPDPPLLAFYAIAFGGGLATAFDNPARRSFAVELVPQEHVQNAVSLNSAMMTSSRIFGPALAGLLIETVGFGWCFAVDGLSYVAVLAGLWLIDPAGVRAAPITARGKGQVRAGLRYVRRVPVLWISLAMMTLIGTFTFNFAVVYPLFIKRTLGGTDMAFTLFFSISSVGSLVGALATARRKTAELRDVIVAAFAFGVATAALAAAPSLGFAYPLAILAGGYSIAFMTTSTAIVQLRADPVMRGRVLALQAMVIIGSTPIGGPILGAVCERWGARAGLLVGAAAALAAAAFGAVMARRVADPALPTDDLVTAGTDLVTT